MFNCKNILMPPQIQNLFDTLERAGISKLQVIVLSINNIKSLTKLSNEDILLLRNIVSHNYCVKIDTGNELLNNKIHSMRVSTGFKPIDMLLNGGFRRGVITEIYGESGTGKTQIGIQTAVHNWQTGCIYICTEDLFPIKRFEQIKKGLLNYSLSVDYGKNIFVEHVTEPHELMSCVKVRLKKLLSKLKLSLIIIDSIAAPFRCENTNYVQRAEEIKELSISLMKLAQEYELAILCINQVTTSFDVPNNILPSLGLTWSNMISSRLCLKRTSKSVLYSNPQKKYNYDQPIFIRELSVVFAPDLPSSQVNFVIGPLGILNV